MQKKVLALLREAGDGYISGEEIARRLNVSRTAVWKHIRTLKAAGYEIESHARKGYSLIEAGALYDSQPARIRRKYSRNFKQRLLGKI